MPEHSSENFSASSEATGGSNRPKESENQGIILDGPPMSSVQWRRDGGFDRITRINFLGEISPEQMLRIIELLISSVREGASMGFVALTKMEFLEPDTCEFRFWTARTGDDVASMLEHVWRGVGEIHPIRNIDGVRYSWLRQERGVNP